MAVPRPLLLISIAMLLLAATFYAARGARERAAEPAASPTPPVNPASKPASPPKARAGKDAAKPDSPVKKDRAAPKATAGDRPVGREVAPADTGIPRRVGNGKPRPLSPLDGPDAAVPPGVPRRMAHALRHRRTVVLFLGTRGADDVATASGVASLRGLERVSVFFDRVEHLARYRAMLTGLGVAQAPAVVIVGPDRKAQLVEGFVDAGTLFQLVVDAR